MVRAFGYYECDPRLMDAPLDLYIWGGKTRDIGKYRGETRVTSGISQGCTGSPMLSVMVVNIAINSAVDSGMKYRDCEFIRASVIPRR